MAVQISKSVHPEYENFIEDYRKWRLTYKGGRMFVDLYLQRFSARETVTDFEKRRAMSHCPAFAKSGINKLKNTFYSRMSEITRLDGPKSYMDAVVGKGFGVDLHGSTMNAFLGQTVLPELMSMGRVGIFVDRAPLRLQGDKPILSDNATNSPYLYMYPIEAIRNWDMWKRNGEYEYCNLILEDQVMAYDELTGLPTAMRTLFRHMWIAQDGFVHMQMWEAGEKPEDPDKAIGDEQTLQLRAIPFITPALQESLLADVCDYQIGLLNIASSDMNFVVRANVPFYIEPFDPATDNIYRRPMFNPNTNEAGEILNAAGVVDPNYPQAGQATAAMIAQPKNEIQVGTLDGRRYPYKGGAPAFIAPPSEPLLASMKKQEQMKLEIGELLDIAASNATSTHASAESKQLDDRGLESGLSSIGLELEWAEQQVAKFWQMYEGSEKHITVKYPAKYSLKSDTIRLQEAKNLDELKASIPSRTAAKKIAVQLSRLLLVDKVSEDELNKIKTEIEDAEYITSDPKTIQIASELGMVDAVTGSNALGFNGEKVVPKAQEEHAKRLAVIAESQATGEARGVGDQGTKQGQPAKQEKKASQKPSDTDPTPSAPKVRGEGK